MDAKFWHERWRKSEIAFHEAEPNGLLVRHLEQLTLEAGSRVFLPLCGKTLDIAWLAARGHHVVGVELVEAGIRELCSEQGIAAEVTDEGAFRVYRAPNIELRVGDLFDLTPELVGDIDRIWDRGSMVAFPPERREAYVHALRSISGPNTELLLSAISYDPAVMTGPPWSVPRADVERLYADCQIRLLHANDVIDDAPHWRELGHESWVVSLYAISW
jgi:thiopurine S-methyltransferase